MNLKKLDINLINGTIPFYYKNTEKDYGSYYAKILKGEVYKPINLKHSVEKIIDLGANFGSASIHFALRFPKAKIYSFEPVSESFEILKINSKIFQNISIFNLAASDSDGYANVHIDPEKMGRSSLIDNHLNYSFKNSEKIKTINFNKFLLEKKLDFIDLLKIDIEGSEYKVFNSIRSHIKNINLIYIELHGKINIQVLRESLLISHNEIEFVLHREDLAEAIYLNKHYEK